jgi:hypothetical protein
LKQRVALRCQIGPLSLPETAAYISSRIRTAGGDTARLFTREAVTLVHEHARGIPRTISVICDNALVHGFALSKQPVTREIVLDVCRDFDLRGGAIAPATQGGPAEREPGSPARPAGRAGSGGTEPRSAAPRGPAAASATEFEKTENRARVLSMLGLR